MTTVEHDPVYTSGNEPLLRASAMHQPQIPRSTQWPKSIGTHACKCTSPLPQESPPLARGLMNSNGIKAQAADVCQQWRPLRASNIALKRRIWGLEQARQLDE